MVSTLIHLTEEQQSFLGKIAEDRGFSADSLIQDAIDSYIDKEVKDMHWKESLIRAKDLKPVGMTASQKLGAKLKGGQRDTMVMQTIREEIFSKLTAPTKG